MLKRKIITTTILIILICGICTICSATQTGTVYLESNQDTVESGDEIEITVNLSENTVAAFEFSLYFDETKWKYVSDVENTNVENNRIIHVWYDVTGGESPNQGALAKFKFKAKEEGLSTFSLDGEFYNTSGQLIEIDFKETQVQIGKENTALQIQSEEEQGTNSQAGNSYLQSLRLDVEGINPTFDKDTYEYYITVPTDVKEIEVLAISENPNASINISGNTELKEDLNTIKVSVTSEDGKSEKKYNIYVTRTADLEAANTNLEILAIENALLTPPFDANETRYKTEVSKDTENLNIFAVPENENAKVEIEGGANLKEGDNLVTVVVTAVNGFSTKKYQVEVHKRTEEEQTQYEQEQSEQAEKVEEAYEIEKLSSIEGEHSEEEREKAQEEAAKNTAIWCTVIVVVILIIGGIIFWYFRYKNKKLIKK